MKKLLLLTFLLVVLAIPNSAAIMVSGYEERHTLDVTQLLLSDQDIVVAGVQYAGMAYSTEKVRIDTDYTSFVQVINPDGSKSTIYDDYTFKQIMNHELAHIYCYNQGWGFGHNACFRDRNRLLGQLYHVVPIDKNGRET